MKLFNQYIQVLTNILSKKNWEQTRSDLDRNLYEASKALGEEVMLMQEQLKVIETQVADLKTNLTLTNHALASPKEVTKSPTVLNKISSYLSSDNKNED